MVSRTLPRISAVRANVLPRHSIGAADLSKCSVSLTLYRDIADARESWEQLQETGVCAYPQCHAYAEAWSRCVSRPDGAEPIVVVGRARGGKPLFVWAFDLVSRRGLKVLQWIGQEHANYNFGLYDRTFAKRLDAKDIRILLRAIAGMAGNVSAADLRNQPFEWDGLPNPFRHLPQQAAPNAGYVTILDGDYETLYRNHFSGRSRNGLRRKARKLEDARRIEFRSARNCDAGLEILESFFAQKAEQFARAGIADSFADERHKAFYRAIAQLPPGTPGRLELASLDADGAVAATYGAIHFANRVTLLLSSITQDDISRYSPGALLLHDRIEQACREGYHWFDLGIGQAKHKSDWSDLEVPLFDNFVALDEFGYILTVPLALKTAAKRIVKTNPMLWSAAKFIRRSLYGQTSGETAAAD